VSAPHYDLGDGVQPIDVCERLSFNLGNVVKYASRAGRKPGTSTLDDLRKARWYIDREIERVEQKPAEATPKRKPWLPWEEQ
jgi:hypothetical protein